MQSLVPHSQPWVTASDLDAVQAVVASGMHAQGDQTSQFCADLAQALAVAHVDVSQSGTAALVVALRALDLGAGDEVIIPTYVCDSVMRAVRSVGAEAVLCDIGRHWVMTAETVAPHVRDRTRAIIAVHTFGITVDVSALRRFGLPIVEDCCQALGRDASGAWIGGTADVAVYSFHPTKCLSAGAGGAVASSRQDIIDKIARQKREFGTLFGFTDLQATLARSQFRRYPEALDRRRAISQRYLADLPSTVRARSAELVGRSMFFRFPLWQDARFELIRAACEAGGVLVRRGVDSLLHRKLDLPDASFPGAVAAYDATVSIPILPHLTDDQVERVVSSVTKALRSEAQ